MSALRLALRSALHERLDLSGVTPLEFSGRSIDDIARIPLANRNDRKVLGDLFEISGEISDTLVIAPGSAELDFVGAGMTGGNITVEGDVGAWAGREMKGGRLDIKGGAGHGLAAGLKDGLVTVKGKAGDFVGGVLPGEKFGMTGGIVIVDGDIGERAGDRMRRGTIVTRGKTGASAGSRMVGGTIIAEGGLGAMPGALMRRGTLIAPSVAQWLPTYSDCGSHDLNILKIMNRYYASTLGALAPKPFPLMVRRYAGDLATIGKGEILITA